jgi:hypothetical protein
MNGKIQYYQVIIENDGKKPSGTFYGRLARLGLSVRGNKNLGVITRRTVKEGSAEGSIIIQEGVILCPSYSLAQQIAHWASDEGATVLIGTAELEMFRPTVEDNEAFLHLDAKVAKRGPKNKAPELLVCLEEAKSYLVENGEILCPHCRASAVEKYPYSDEFIVEYQDDKTTYENWLLTRFCTGTFIIPSWASSVTKGNKPIQYTAQGKVYGENIADRLAQLFGVDLCFRYLDSIYICNNRIGDERRIQSRARALVAYLLRGGDPATYQITSLTPDILDAGAVAGADTAASLALQMGSLK